MKYEKWEGIEALKMYGYTTVTLKINNRAVRTYCTCGKCYTEEVDCCNPPSGAEYKNLRLLQHVSSGTNNLASIGGPQVVYSKDGVEVTASDIFDSIMFGYYSLNVDVDNNSGQIRFENKFNSLIVATDTEVRVYRSSIRGFPIKIDEKAVVNLFFEVMAKHPQLIEANKIFKYYKQFNENNIFLLDELGACTNLKGLYPLFENHSEFTNSHTSFILTIASSFRSYNIDGCISTPEELFIATQVPLELSKYFSDKYFDKLISWRGYANWSRLSGFSKFSEEFKAVFKYYIECNRFKFSDIEAAIMAIPAEKTFGSHNSAAICKFIQRNHYRKDVVVRCGEILEFICKDNSVVPTTQNLTLKNYSIIRVEELIGIRVGDYIDTLQNNVMEFLTSIEKKP